MKNKTVAFMAILILIAVIITIIMLMNNTVGRPWRGNPNNNLRINFSNLLESEKGYAASVWGDKIYYISNELDTMGIYSMDMDGSNVQLEVKNPSVTSLQWRNDTLYFVGLEKIEDNTASVWMTDHIYTVYKKGSKENKIEKVDFVEYDESIRGVYLISDSCVAINYGTQRDYLIITSFGNSGNTTLNSTSLIKEGIICFQAPITEQLESQRQGGSSDEERFIFSTEGAYLITQEEKSNIFGKDSSILDSKTGEVVLSLDGVRTNFEYFKTLFMDNDYLYGFYKSVNSSKTGQMVIVNRETWEVEKMFPLDDIAETHRVSYAMKRDGKIYMLAEQWSSDYEPALPLKNQKLLVMDPETFEWEVVRDMKEGERIVGLDERGIVYLANGGIWKAEWEGEAFGGETRLCDAPKDIDKEKYTIDYAGDWMFVYKVYGGFTTGNLNDDPGQQLVYKINLKTGEVVENTVPLDFSQVDPYRRDSKTK